MSRPGRHDVNPGQIDTGELAVTCWCETTVVFVDPERVKAGGTESCGRLLCKPSSPVPSVRRRKPDLSKLAAAMVDGDLYRWLKADAEAHNRTLDETVRFHLANARHNETSRT